MYRETLGPNNEITKKTWSHLGGGGFEDFVDIFKMSSQIGLDLGGISMYVRLSSKG